MNPQTREVYVPTRLPDRDAATEDDSAWPRPAFTPGEGGRERALAARVREALAAGRRRPGPDDTGPDVVDLFRSPAVAREVVGRLSREARRHGCTAIVATGPGGGAVGAPVAVDAGLPLVVADGPGDGPAGRTDRPPGAEGSALPGEGHEVLLVAGAADSGERLAAAADRVERAGGRVAAVAVVVEVAGGGVGDRLSDYNLLSLLTL